MIMKFSQLLISSFILTSFLLFSIEQVNARDCEIVDTRIYQKTQNVIVTDWRGDSPYKKYTTEIYSCAHITIKNTFWQSLYSEDFKITATFVNQSTIVKKLKCEKKQIEPDEKYSCDICFESEYAISALDCTMR
jgi:hypothetical protein